MGILHSAMNRRKKDFCWEKNSKTPSSSPPPPPPPSPLPLPNFNTYTMTDEHPWEAECQNNSNNYCKADVHDIEVIILSVTPNRSAFGSSGSIK